MQDDDAGRAPKLGEGFMCVVAAMRLASQDADSTPATPPTVSAATAPTGDGYNPSYHFKETCIPILNCR